MFISCKENTTERINSKKPKEKVKSEFKYDFEFPDTVYRNESYKGKIKFSSILDTLTKNVMEEKNGIDRYILFSMTKTKTLDYSIEELRKMKLDTFGATNHNTIPLQNIKFENIGTYYIYGILNDHATINTSKIPKPTDKVRYIENESRISYKVIVIDKATTGNSRLAQ